MPIAAVGRWRCPLLKERLESSHRTVCFLFFALTSRCSCSGRRSRVEKRREVDVRNRDTEKRMANITSCHWRLFLTASDSYYDIRQPESGV